MNRWLFKSEPDVFSWDDLVARGAAQARHTLHEAVQRPRRTRRELEN